MDASTPDEQVRPTTGICRGDLMFVDSAQQIEELPLSKSEDSVCDETFDGSSQKSFAMDVPDRVDREGGQEVLAKQFEVVVPLVLCIDLATGRGHTDDECSVSVQTISNMLQQLRQPLFGNVLQHLDQQGDIEQTLEVCDIAADELRTGPIPIEHLREGDRLLHEVDTDDVGVELVMHGRCDPSVATPHVEDRVRASRRDESRVASMTAKYSRAQLMTGPGAKLGCSAGIQ